MNNILTNQAVYEGSLIHQRFAYKFFRKDTYPLGDIVAFRAPMHVQKDGMIDLEDVLDNDYIFSKDAVNLCWEIPNLEPLGAVAFQRLFNVQIAQILYSIIGKQIEVNGDDIFVVEDWVGHDGKTRTHGKCSVSITYSKNNVALGHTGINVDAGPNAPAFAYSTHMTDDQIRSFMIKVVDRFYELINSLFLATTKITIV